MWGRVHLRRQAGKIECGAEYTYVDRQGRLSVGQSTLTCAAQRHGLLLGRKDHCVLTEVHGGL